MDVHRADIAAVLIAPDEVKQIFAGVDAVRVADEQLDKVKLARRQLNGLSVLIDVALLRVHGQAAGCDAVVLIFQPAAAAQQGADARLQLQNVEGLCQIVVRAVLKAKQLVHVLRAGSEHDNGNVRKFPNGAAGGQPVDLRHHDVQHDEPDVRIARQLDGLASVASGDDLIAVVLQVEANALDQQLFIIYDQYFHGSTSTVTSSRSFSSLPSPMPSTAMSSSTLRKGPCASR